MAAVHHGLNLVVAVLVGIVLTVAGGCDGEKGAERPPAAGDGSPAAQVTQVVAPADMPSPVTGPAATMPIIDLHFHPSTAWDRPVLLKLFDELGVVRAGNGSGDSDLILRFAAQYPDRYIPFGGEGPVRGFVRAEGERAWNLESPAVLEYLDQLEAGFRTGQFEGIGELYPNNLTGNAASLQSRYPPDSPLMQRL